MTYDVISVRMPRTFMWLLLIAHVFNVYIEKNINEELKIKLQSEIRQDTLSGVICACLLLYIFISSWHNPQNQTDNYQFLLVNTSTLFVLFIYRVSLNYAAKFHMKCADKLLQ